MAISQLPQAPYRQDRKIFPTPVVGDVLFSQVKDCTRIEIPEYGTPHPDTKKWPDHKLVFVKPVDIERDGIFEFFYAADRDNQDPYNFTYSQGELVLTRTYIVSRDSLEDFVEPKLGQDDPAFPEYKFATQQVQRVEDKELDSLYVAVQRFYAKHNTTFAVDTETKTGYKIRRVSTLNKELSESGNSSSSFNEKGWTNRQETVQITGGTTLTTIDQKPFVKVQSDTTISGTPVVPETGTGSSRLIYDNGDTKVYENVNDTSTPKTGPAGVEKESRPYAVLTTDKSYSTSNEVTGQTGSSQVVFNDGETTVYEVSNVTATPRQQKVGDEKEERPYASLNTAKRYSTNSDVATNTGSSNIVWTDGSTTIYEINEVSAIAKAANVGEEKEERPYASLKTNKRYSTSGSVTTGTGSSNVVWTDGLITIYEVNEVTASAKLANVGEEKEERPYASLRTSKRYSTNSAVSTKTGSSNVVWTDGVTTIYEVNEVTASAKSASVGVEKEERPYASLRTTKRYSIDNTVNTKTGSSNIVWTDGDVTIYEVNDIAAVAKTGDVGKEKEERPYATLTTDKKYSTSPEVSTKTGSSNIVWTDGDIKIYEVNTITAQAKETQAGKEKEERPYATLTTEKKYSASPEVSTKTGSSNIVWTDGNIKIYEVNTITAQAKESQVGEEKEERPYATLTTEKKYSASPEVSTKTGSSNIVWTDGDIKIYEVNTITAQAKESQVGEEKEERPYATLTTEKKYSASPNVSTKTGSSNIVWTDGDTKIYEVNTITAQAKETQVGEEKEERPYATLTTEKKYSTSPDVSTKTGSSNIVWTDGDTKIYEVNTITAQAKEEDVGEEKEERPYATLTTNKKYSTSSEVSTRTGSSNIVWTDGDTKIYEVNTITADSKEEEVGEEKEVRPYVKLVTKKRYSTSNEIDTETGSSNVVWTDGEVTIYELSEITPEPKLKEYGSEFRAEPWGKYKIRKEYIDTLDEGSTALNQQNIIWSDGEQNIFEKSEFEITEANSDKYTSEKSLKDGPYIEKTETSYIKATSAESIDSQEDYYTVTEVFNDGKSKVFRLDERKLENSPLEWEEIINYEWPSVLEDIRFEPWTSKINGQATYFPRADYKQGFSGPQKATKKQYWQKEKPSITPPQLMVPKGISYRSPMLSLDIPPCLHSTFTIDATNGTTDPDWEYTQDVETYEATEPADWPEEIKWTESIPLKGGYLVTETIIRKPEIG